jgi:hypothetical protein
MSVSTSSGQIAISLSSIAGIVDIEHTRILMLPKMSAWDYILSSTQNETEEQASVNAPYVSGESHLA